MKLKVVSEPEEKKVGRHKGKIVPNRDVEKEEANIKDPKLVEAFDKA